MVVFFRAGYEFFCSFIGIFLTPKDKKTLHGKISIVTGAGQGIKQKIWKIIRQIIIIKKFLPTLNNFLGIGRELAFKLAREGARVICVDKIEETNVETANKIREEIKGIAHPFTCDVTKRDQIEELHTKVRNSHWELTIL